MPGPLRRREFLRQVALTGAASAVTWSGHPALGFTRNANEKLNIGVIGTAHRAAANLAGVQGENIVALCDIDDNYLGAASERFPGAKTYNDFRKLLEQKDIDAVVVSTADHTHAFAASIALALGKPVYCEKPLAHDPFEARYLAKAAARAGVATQMGTQIHAGDNYRRVVELVRSGAIGPVREVHVWCGKSWSGGERPTDTPPVPKTLHWDLWLGPAPERPYNPTYLPATWRRWWDFGCGTLGDMACHYMDLPTWALDLRHPTTVQAEGPPVHPETAPSWMIVQWTYPERGDKPPVKLTWYDGGKRPDLPDAHRKGWGDAVLFVGEKGNLLSDYSRHQLLPEETFKDFEPPPKSIPSSIGHHQEWLQACRTGGPTTCNFDYSGALSEAVLLGNVAYRTGKPLTWDAENLKAVGCPEADQYIHREYRKGWSLA